VRACQYCGNDNLEVLDYAEGLTDDRKYQVHCYYCGASGPFAWTYDKAVEKWEKITDRPDILHTLLTKCGQL